MIRDEVVAELRADIRRAEDCDFSDALVKVTTLDAAIALLTLPAAQPKVFHDPACAALEGGECQCGWVAILPAAQQDMEFVTCLSCGGEMGVCRKADGTLAVAMVAFTAQQDALRAAAREAFARMDDCPHCCNHTDALLAALAATEED